MLVYQRVSYIILPLPHTLWGLLPGFFWSHYLDANPSTRTISKMERYIDRWEVVETQGKTNKPASKQTNKHTGYVKSQCFVFIIIICHIISERGAMFIHVRLPGRSSQFVWPWFRSFAKCDLMDPPDPPCHPAPPVDEDGDGDGSLHRPQVMAMDTGKVMETSWTLNVLKLYWTLFWRQTQMAKLDIENIGRGNNYYRDIIDSFWEVPKILWGSYHPEHRPRSIIGTPVVHWRCINAIDPNNSTYLYLEIHGNPSWMMLNDPIC